jgi:hypothetical protein
LHRPQQAKGQATTHLSRNISRAEPSSHNSIYNDVSQRKLFGVVYGTLSLTSRDRVTSSPEYAAIRESDNGFDLWKLTHKVHTAGGTNESEVRRKDRIAKEYISCRKEQWETLAQFHARFQDRIRDMKATTQEVSEPSQAIRFIDSLDNSNFYEFKRMVENGPTLGVAYPATLAAALEAANNFVPPNSSFKSSHHRENTVAVYKTHKSELKKASRETTAQGQERKGSKDGGQEQGKFPYKCHNCHKVGHKAKDCRNLKKAAYHVKAEAANEEDVLSQE